MTYKDVEKKLSAPDAISGLLSAEKQRKLVEDLLDVLAKEVDQIAQDALDT